jgi:hypothetical protein
MLQMVPEFIHSAADFRFCHPDKGEPQFDQIGGSKTERFRQEPGRFG